MLEGARLQRAAWPVQGLPRLNHLALGRRKLVRGEWLDQLMEASKTR